MFALEDSKVTCSKVARNWEDAAEEKCVYSNVNLQNSPSAGIGEHLQVNMIHIT